MPKASTRLGRGLSALITSTPDRLATDTAATVDAAESSGQLLPVASIRPSRVQPRQTFDPRSLAELAESIRAQGVLQPLIVRPLGDGTYELVAGERRWRAAQQAGLELIPAVVRTVSDAEALELSLVENLQRADLNPVERARAYRQYLDTFGGTVEELAARLGESRPNISNYLRLLNLSEDILAMLSAGELEMGHARAIAAVADPARQLAIARLAARRKLAVRQVEELARSTETRPVEPGITRKRPVHIADAEQALSRSLGLPVTLLPGRKRNTGRIVISYRSLEDFERVARRLGLNPNQE